MTDPQPVTTQTALPQVQLVTPEAYRERAHSAATPPALAVCFGEVPCRAVPWLELRPAVSPLSTHGVVELWDLPGAPQFGYQHGVRFARTTEFAIGAAHVAATPDDPNLDELTERVYSGILDTVEGLKLPNTLRFWNYLPDINAEQNGVERYQRFCAGRQHAFNKTLGLSKRTYPAASALGVPRDSTCDFYFLAGAAPGVEIDNPNQVDAYRYPKQYGTPGPAFARATFVGSGHAGLLMISGTASIVGHRSKHAGDPIAQTRQTLGNLSRVARRATQLTGRQFPFARNTSILKVYIRHPEHYDDIRAVIEREIGSLTPAAYMQADVCRSELLVEIECTIQGRRRD